MDDSKSPERSTMMKRGWVLLALVVALGALIVLMASPPTSRTALSPDASQTIGSAPPKSPPASTAADPAPQSGQR